MNTCRARERASEIDCAPPTGHKLPCCLLAKWALICLGDGYKLPCSRSQHEPTASRLNRACTHHLEEEAQLLVNKVSQVRQGCQRPLSLDPEVFRFDVVVVSPRHKSMGRGEPREGGWVAVG